MAYQRTQKVEARLAAREVGILDAARQVFAERGYHGSTMRDIAAAAGVATGTLYLYFPSKEALYEALLVKLTTLVLEAIVQARGGQPDVISKLEASISAAVTVFAANADLARIVLVQAAGADPSFEERLTRVHRTLASFVREDLEEAIGAGRLPSLDTEVAAMAWVGTFYEVIMSWLRDGRPDPLESSIATLVSYNLRAIGALPSGASAGSGAGSGTGARSR
ncbi:MAG: TetR family transcriptional regulator [Symbiobacteriia bacterium]